MGATVTLFVVGLGPGDPRFLTVEAEPLLKSSQRVLVRTRHHPTVEALDPEGRWPSCDDLLSNEEPSAQVRRAIVERVLAAAESGDVVYAVPGHPLVGEATVLDLLAALGSDGVRVLPGLSFVDIALAALGADGSFIQVCDALALRVDVQRPALVGHVQSKATLGEMKASLLAVYPPHHEVALISALGTNQQRVDWLPLAHLGDRPFDPPACVYLPPLSPEDDVRRFDGLYAIVSRLHAPNGCPWDRQQTHESLKPHLLEETYEVLDAIEAGEPARLAEELGDLLLQILMHEAVARRLHEFTLGDVTQAIARKLIRRHPHVFGTSTAQTAEEVERSWEELKAAERGESSILDGVPRSMPALAASQVMQGRARRLGFDWPDIEGPLEKLLEEVREFTRSENADEREDEFGDILFVLANISQRLGIDAEAALRRANEKFRRRFGRVETLAREQGLDLRALDLAALDALWEEAKRAEEG